MNAEQLLASYGTNARSIDKCVRDWRSRELYDFLGQEIAAGVMLGDYLVDKSLIDNVPQEVQDAAALLRGDEMDSKEELIRHILDMIERGEEAVGGAIIELKGKVGEILFLEQVGEAGRLAASTTQEGWDIAIDRGIEGTQYVQVKIYADPNGVISEMRKVQESLNSEMIRDGDEIVRQIDFAVPSDIAADVIKRMGDDSDLSNINVIEIQSSGANITSSVGDTFQAVSEQSMEHFFGQLFGATLSAAALHAATNAFLVYKEAKTIRMAMMDAATSSAISAGGLGSGLLVDHVLSSVTTFSGPVGVAVGIASRAVLNAYVHSRMGLVEQLDLFSEDLDQKIAAFEITPSDSMHAGM